MPSYRVKEKGFFGGQMYDPKGKRRILHSDKPLKPVPKWLDPIVDTSPKKSKRAEAAEAKAAKEAEEKAKADKVEVDAATFINGPSHTVEVL